MIPVAINPEWAAPLGQVFFQFGRLHYELFRTVVYVKLRPWADAAKHHDKTLHNLWTEARAALLRELDGSAVVGLDPKMTHDPPGGPAFSVLTCGLIPLRNALAHSVLHTIAHDGTKVQVIAPGKHRDKWIRREQIDPLLMRINGVVEEIASLRRDATEALRRANRPFPEDWNEIQGSPSWSEDEDE